MKKLLFCVLFSFTSLIFAQQTSPVTSLTTFFEGFHARDSIKIKSVLAPYALLFRTSNSKDGTPSRSEMKISSFIKAVTTRPDTPVWLEQLGTPIVNQHQNLALVWVPFQFFRDEVISHCGYNSFTMFWNGNKWLITSISDTGTTDCETIK